MSHPPQPPDGSQYPGWPGQQPPSNPGSAGPPPPAFGYLPYPGYPVHPAYFSHRTKAAAGLLQLLPGFFLALGGIGRCYTGHVALGVVHIVLSILGWLLTPIFGLGLPIVFACWLWAVIDGIVLLAGRPTDADHRLLR